MKIKKLWKRIFIIFGALILLAFILVFGINLYVQQSVKDRILSVSEMSDQADSADCIIVLGAGLRNSSTPSLMLEERLNTGIELYNVGTAPKLLMSGDHGRDGYNEVEVMKTYSTEHDVPSSDIFMDHAGFSTYESMYRAKDIFKAKKVIIVSQKYHLYRALYIARALGLEAYGVPSDTRTYAGQTYREIREILARDKDFFISVFKPEPTYLGDSIPVNGNGDITNG